MPSNASANGWLAASEGLGGIMAMLAKQRQQKKEDERTAMLDKRAVDWHNEGVNRETERDLLDLTLRYGAGPAPAPSSGVGMRPTSFAEVDAPALDGIGAALSGAGSRALRTPPPAPLYGGSADSVPARMGNVAAPGAGVGVQPTRFADIPRASTAPTVQFAGRTLTIDPSRSVDGMRDVQARAQREAEQTAQIAALTPALEAAYGDKAPAMAAAIIRSGVKTSDLAYQPLSRDQQFTDFRETGEINDGFAARQSGRTFANQQTLQNDSQAFTAGENALNRTHQATLAGSPTGAGPTKEADRVRSMQNVSAAFGNYKTLMADYLGGSREGRAAARFGFGNQAALGQVEAAKTALTFELKNLYDLGALQAPDIELINGLLADPRSLRDPAYGLAQLAEAQKVIERRTGLPIGVPLSSGNAGNSLGAATAPFGGAYRPTNPYPR